MADDLLSLLPHGWNVKVEWFNDDYPCVTLTLSRDFGRVSHAAHGHGDTLHAALDYAVHDALALVARAEKAA